MKSVRILLCASVSLFAQNDTSDLPVLWQWEGLHAVRLAGTASLRTEAGGASSAHSQADLYAQLPIIRKSDNYFGTGIVYRAVIPQFELDGKDSLSFDTESAHSAQLVLAWWHKFGEKTSLYSEYNGGAAGLWRSPENSQAHLAFTYFGFKPKSNRFYRAGIAAAYQFGKPAFYPLLGTALGFTDHWALDVMVPTHAVLRFKVNRKLEFAAKGNYSLGAVGFETDSEPVSYCWSYFSGGAYGDIRIYKDLILRIEGGEQFLRKIELKTTNSDSLITLEPKPAPFATVSVRWQI